MEFFKLDSSYRPSTTVIAKDEDTLVWTERYQANGEFVYETEDDISILDVLPEGTLVSHNNTRQVMIVETHSIKRDKDKKLKVKLSGRSFDTFAEQRATAGSASALYDGAGDQIVESITGTPEAVATQILSYGLEPGTASANDAVPNLNVYMVIRDPDSSRTHVIKRGDIYKAVREILNVSGAGIKTIRPEGATTTLDLVVHDGLDKTASVIFHALTDDLEDPEYLRSIRNYKTHAQIAAHDHARLYRHRDLVADVTGLNRRTLYVDADDIEGAFAVPTSTDAVATRAQGELDEHKRLSLMSAKIATTATPKFKIHYDVGDLVRVFGEFNSVQTMRVTEHILTYDKTGMRGYPTLNLV